MTEDLTERLAGLSRAMATPLPSPEELAAGKAADRAMAERIHKARPGVPLHHAYAVLETLRTIQRVEAAKAEPTPPQSDDGFRWHVLSRCPDETGCPIHGRDVVEPIGHEDGVDLAELTRADAIEAMQEMGTELYKAEDRLAFVREMCDLADREGRTVTTGQVRGWTEYEGCGGVLRLPDDVLAVLREQVESDREPETEQQLHARFACPGWQYATTEGPRKQWDDQDRPPSDEHGDPDPSWEVNVDAGREGWERFDYTEEAYWRRRKPDTEPSGPSS